MTLRRRFIPERRGLTLIKLIGLGYRSGIKFGVLGLAGLLFLTGCAQTDYAYKSLNEQLYYQYVLLEDLPCAFCDKTNEEWIPWQKASKTSEDLRNQMDAHEGCYYKDPNF